MRPRGVVLMLMGAAYLAGCVLLVVAHSEAQVGLWYLGLAATVGAYGGASAFLLLRKRRRLRALELALVIVFGFLFRLVLMAARPGGLGSLEPLLPLWLRGSSAASAASFHPPLPPLMHLLASFLYVMEPQEFVGRLVLMVFEVGVWGVLLVLLEEERRPSAWLILYVWSPLAVMNSGAGGVTSGVVFLLVLGLWLYRRGLVERGLVCLGLTAAGSYLVWPAAVLLGMGSGRRLLTLAMVAAVGVSCLVVAHVDSGWSGSLWETALSTTRNSGLFSLAAWVTGTPWAGWGALLALLGGVAWAYRRGEPVARFDAMLKAAIVGSPVVLAGGLHVLLPLLVLRPTLTWVAFTCVVVLLQGAFPDGAVPTAYLAMEYGGLAAGITMEQWLKGGRWLTLGEDRGATPYCPD